MYFGFLRLGPFFEVTCNHVNNLDKVLNPEWPISRDAGIDAM